MTYAIEGTGIPLQPEEGQWLPRELLRVDGNGRPIYSPYHSFEMSFSPSTPAEHWQLQQFFELIGSTGSVVVDLPRYPHTSYEFFSYTGCILQEPEVGSYFQEHFGRVRLVVTRIRV